MCSQDTSVDDIRAGALSRGAVVDIGGVALFSVRNTAKTPRSTVLKLPVNSLDLSILLNVLNLHLLVKDEIGSAPDTYRVRSLELRNFLVGKGASKASEAVE